MKDQQLNKIGNHEIVIILLTIYNKNISVMLIIHGRNTQTMLLSGVEIIRNGLLESLLLKGIN